jgi:4-hydroxy-2-oxoheptanedioate aldolase
MIDIKEKIKAGKSVSNAWTTIPSSWTAELISQVGFDVMTIDAQHGLATDLSSILPIFQAMQGSDTMPFVRLPANDAAFAMRMLDAGAMGIICPMIKTREETERFVSNCRFKPSGERSFGPIRSSKINSDYFNKSNDLITTMAMIETKEAVENLADIAKTENLNGFYVGPWDLSLSLGLDKMADFEDPKLQQVFDKILNEADKNGLFVGLHCGGVEEGLKMEKMGFKFLTIFNDSRAIQTAAHQSAEAFTNSSKGFVNSNEAY